MHCKVFSLVGPRTLGKVAEGLAEELDWETMASKRCLPRVEERAMSSGSESRERSICSIDLAVENVGVGARRGAPVSVEEVRRRL